MDIFITGERGFIGARFAVKFNFTNHYKVLNDNLSLSNRKSVCFSHKFFKHDMEDKLHEYVYDIHRFDTAMPQKMLMV